MAFRHKLRKKTSRRVFSKTARRVHKKNVLMGPQRGGIRL